MPQRCALGAPLISSPIVAAVVNALFSLRAPVACLPTFTFAVSSAGIVPVAVITFGVASAGIVPVTVLVAAAVVMAVFAIPDIDQHTTCIHDNTKETNYPGK